jgi:hypothetical protein
VVQGVYAHERRAYKQRQRFHLVLNTMFTTRLPNFSIAIKVDKSRIKTPCLSLNQYVTPDFTRKTECISCVRQDQFTHT